MASSAYKGTSIGFVLSPVSPDSAAPADLPNPDEMVSVPVAALNAAENYIKALEAKVAQLSLKVAP